jgi:hypothetical protein
MLVFQQYAVKYKMHNLEEFENEKLQSINLTSIQYQRFKVDDHEIKFNGKLYDIVFSEFKNGVYKLTVFHDEKEESILNEIAIFFKYKCKSNQKLPLRANQLLLSNYILSNVGFLNINFSPACSILINAIFKLNLLSPFSAIFLPPPRY